MTVASTRPAWTVLAAIGAAFVAGSVAYSVTALVYSFIDFGDRATPLWSAMAIGAFAGAAIARAAGGLLGVLAFAAYLAAGAAITVGWEAFYEQAIQGSSFYFISVSAVQLALWQVPSVIAIVLGSLAGTRIARGRQGTNAFLEAVGAYSFVATIVITFVRGPIDPRLALYSVTFAPAAIHIPFVLGQAIAAATILALRWRGPMRPFAVAGASAAVGLVSVMPDDFTMLVNKFRFNWTEYWPQSLILVPLATAAVVLAVTALASRRPGRAITA
jgi:hypothetical protein